MTRITATRLRMQHAGERGYILLTILLWVAILSITVSLPMLTYYHQQMKRDREEELVHRGVEYERAIRKYYRKFGSYPASMEMLESSNHLRFLRKRYKDPLNGKDFKLLKMADVMSVMGLGIPGGPGLGQPVGGAALPVAQNSVNSNTTENTNTNATGGTTGTDATSTTGDSSQPTPQATRSNPGTTLPFTPVATLGSSGQQTFGGGGIVGVASINTQQSIRIYNKKDHYNDWLFIYNPSMDRGGLPRGPYEPTLQAVLPGQVGTQPGVQNGVGQQGFGQQGLGQQGFGQQGFGQGSSMMPNRP